MKNHYLNRGFTLIELLVVTAIIGILATVVLGSLSGAQNKAAIASFKQEVRNFASEATLACIDDVAGATTGPVGFNLSDTAGTPAKQTSPFDNLPVITCTTFNDGTASGDIFPGNRSDLECTAQISINGVTFGGTKCS